MQYLFFSIRSKFDDNEIHMDTNNQKENFGRMLVASFKRAAVINYYIVASASA
jgi:hypothetical protein